LKYNGDAENTGNKRMLTGKQRRFLRAMGTGLEPIIHIGKAGLINPVIQQLDEALEARELVKVRVIANSPVKPKDIGSEMAEAARAEMVQAIGRNLLFYRRSITKPVLELPS
jgi:RNA-binding protein